MASTKIARVILGAAAIVTAWLHCGCVIAQAQESSDSPSAGLQEIIVTASRRSEPLQNVPIAVSAVDAASLARQGIQDTGSLGAVVPGLVMSSFGGFATPFIRGIGTTVANAGVEPSVATYIDDVYIGASTATMFSLNNVAQVEVLKGPQGTLFGRNATGGVIQIKTRDPSAEPDTFDANVTYANYDRVDSSIYGSAHFTDYLAADIALYGERQADGWGRFPVTGQQAYTSEDYAARSKWVFTPSTLTKVTATFDFDRVASQQAALYSTVPGSVAFNGQTFTGYFTPGGNDGGITTKQYGVALKVEQDLAWAKFVSITGYRNTRQQSNFDFDGTLVPAVYANFALPDRAFSQEIQLLSEPGGPLSWIAGLFYYNNKASFSPQTLVIGGALDNYTWSTSPGKSYAVYGQGDYEIVPDTRLTLGARYNIDKLSYSGYTDNNNVPPITSAAANTTQEKPTWRLSLDHNYAADLMAYASYNRGTKSGSYNISNFANPVTKPETVDAYELGMKSEWADHRLRFNAAGFFYEYKNIQVTVFNDVTPLNLNGASAQIYGLDLDLQAAPIRDLNLTASTELLHGTYGNFPGAPEYIPSPATCAPYPMATGAPTGGNIQCVINAQGKATVHTPDFSANLAADYTWHITGGSQIYSNASYSRLGSFYWEPDNRLKQPGANLLGAALGWRTADERWDVKVWGKNLLNDYYYVTALSNSFNDDFSMAPPRTFGVTFGIHL